jgi:hypothetical protein
MMEPLPHKEQTMNKHRVELIVAAAILAAFGWSAASADETLAPASGKQAKTEYWMMDHSPADAKAMRLMTKPGSQTAPTSTAKVEYWAMDHSPADIKAMQRMDKKPKNPQVKTEYSLMGHSAGDMKAMRGMKGPEKVVTVGE